MNRDTHSTLLQFEDADSLLQAVGRLRGAGFTRLEAFTPFALEALPPAAPAPGSRLPLGMVLGAVLGGGGTYLLEVYSAVLDYPVNVGGRPLFSWPAFLPPALEMALLGAALAGLLALLWGSRLPRLHHPLFEVEAFQQASQDGFFLWVRERTDSLRLRELLGDGLTYQCHGVPA